MSDSHHPQGHTTADSPPPTNDHTDGSWAAGATPDQRDGRSGKHDGQADALRTTARLAQHEHTPFDPAALQTGNLAVELLHVLAPRVAGALRPSTLLQRGAQARNLLQPAFWRKTDAAVSHHLKALVAFVRRRRQGNYQTDPYGMDPDMVEVARPFFRFLYRDWWRVQTEGLEHIPATGRALLVANHSGTLPWDGAILTTAVSEDHPSHRLVRNLYLTWFQTTPFLAPIFTSLGQVLALPENAIRLLEDDQLVCTFPEGERGISKPFHQRYQLVRFGRGGFVRVALRTGSPIIPVAIIGAEEIYPLVGKNKLLARLLGIPYFPMTPFFPSLGLLGMVPLPTRWSITFCPPISTAAYGPQAADDPLVVFALTEQVRTTIQTTIEAKLAARHSIFG